MNLVHRCKHCKYIAINRWQRAAHIKHAHVQVGRGRVTKDLDIGPFKQVTAFRGSLRTYRQRNRVDYVSYLLFMADIQPYVRNVITNCVHALSSIKSQLTVWAKFKRPIGHEGFEYIDHALNSFMTIITNMAFFEEFYSEAVDKIENSIYLFETYGSGWILDCIRGMDIRVANFRAMKIGCWQAIPNEVKRKRCTVNVRNYDDACFKWAILSVFHPAHSSEQNSSLTSTYRPYEKEYNFSCITYPVEMSAVETFESLNKIAVNVFAWDKRDGLIPHRISKRNYQVGIRTADLLLIQNQHHSHFAGIRNIHKLLGKRGKSAKFLCYNCLNRFNSIKLLEEHIKSCKEFEFANIKMPKINKFGEMPKMKFRNYRHMIRANYVVYADFEALLIPQAKATQIRSSGISEFCYSAPSQTNLNLHVPSGYSYAIVKSDGSLIDYKIYRGKDCIDKFLTAMANICQSVKEISKINLPMRPSSQAEFDFVHETKCWACERDLGDNRVRDHCHITGEYRSIMHAECNLNIKTKSFLPVIIHNFKCYDSHLIIHGFRKFGQKISVIPTNTEKYLSIQVDRIIFLDSLQFLPESLDTLVSNLSTEKFSLLESVFGKEHSKLLQRKGCYPYEYMDSWAKFKEKTLPPMEKFYRTIKDEGVKSEDYVFASEVFDSFNCTDLGMYHDLYLLTDTILLACVFESFRDMCLEYYKLDPVYYLSQPGVAFDAALKMTNVQLDLFTDVDMYEFIESGMRGGVSMVCKRLAEANNKYMGINYNPKEGNSDTFIFSVDCNNLYGTAMKMSLPVGKFRFMSESEVQNFNLTAIPENGPKGYILSVDLSYPRDKHSEHNAYPLAPEKISIPYDQLSTYQRTLMHEMGIKYNDKNKKLIPHLGPRKNYVVHYRNLKYYLRKGMRLKKIRRILEFNQRPWLAKYINFNTKKRAKAENKFEKDFFKFMVNAVYGKTMENKRRRITIHLVNKLKRALHLVAKPQYVAHEILAKNMCTIRMNRRMTKLDKPVYVGFSILDLSKLVMYKFHYDRMLKMYGDNAELLFTDTDSLCYEIKSDDVYADILPYINDFDTSDYDKTSFDKSDSRYHLCSNKNRKVVGKMHDDANGNIITSFAGVGSKSYSIKGQNIKKKALKGVPRFLKERDFSHNLYKNVVENQNRYFCHFNQIRSKRHKLHTQEVKKSAMHAFDSKRFIHEDGIYTSAYYHYLNK